VTLGGTGVMTGDLEAWVRSVSTARRTSAVVAIAAPAAVVAVTALVLVARPLVMLIAAACQAVAIAAVAYALTRTGARRLIAAVAAGLSLVAPLLLIVTSGVVWQLLIVIVLALVTITATRYALGRDIAALKSGPTPGVKVGPATRPILIMNPKSGGGKVERYRLVDEARRRNIEPIVLTPGDDLLRLARDAVARGADVIGMAGGDGSQALVASIAMQHDVAFVCVPAGTRNHLAMDLGLDRGDVVAALDAFGEAVERRIDLGLIGEQVFVNNVAMGLYAKIVQSPQYRDRKVGTVLDMLPAMLGPNTAPFDIQFTLPDGTEQLTAHLMLVSNNVYQLNRGEGIGSRRRVDAGVLGIVAATFKSSNDLARFVQMYAAGRARHFPGWKEWTDTTFEVRSAEPVQVGIDGEARVLDPPIRFRILPGGLRVRIPRHAPGYSPAARAPTPGWATVTALLQTVAGRSISIR
jgi:diacylglycerol kinase family enzyme